MLDITLAYLIINYHLCYSREMIAHV